jgi:hypothetical protein
VRDDGVGMEESALICDYFDRVEGKPAFALPAGEAGIACSMATAYWLACLRWPVLVRRPAIAGVCFGVAAWLAMEHIVVPLSRAQPPPFILPWFIDSVLAHVVLIGLLLAFVARWSASRR